jgi:GNAT superfamily N-acetyltransferase
MTHIFQIRRGQEGDAQGVSRLHAGIWPEEFPDDAAYIAFWRWLFQEYPGSEAAVLVGETPGGEIVGHSALIPYRFQMHDKEYQAGFVCQLMVKEEYRKELLFPRLETSLLRDYPQKGIDFVYGLINLPQVLKAHLAFGFQSLGELRVYARPYDVNILARSTIKNRALAALLSPFLSIARRILLRNRPRRHAGLDVWEFSRFDERFVDFLSEAGSGHPVTTLRTTEILNWRFCRAPGREYLMWAVSEDSTVCGYIVARRMSMRGFDTLAVVDMRFPPQRRDVGKILLHALHQKALEVGVVMSACLLNPHDPMLSTLRRCLYAKTPAVFTLIFHSSQPDLSPAPFEDWHLLWLDHDSV